RGATPGSPPVGDQDPLDRELVTAQTESELALRDEEVALPDQGPVLVRCALAETGIDVPAVMTKGEFADLALVLPALLHPVARLQRPHAHDLAPAHGERGDTSKRLADPVKDLQVVVGGSRDGPPGQQGKARDDRTTRR